MKANELRIGNKLLYNGELCEIEGIPPQRTGKGIDVKFQNGEQVWIELSEFEPIPLTEDWLLKFGFEKDNAGFYKKGRFDYHEDYGWCILGNWVKSWVGVKMPTHVHQLQNLYFALSCEELTIAE